MTTAMKHRKNIWNKTHLHDDDAGWRNCVVQTPRCWKARMWVKYQYELPSLAPHGIAKSKKSSFVYVLAAAIPLPKPRRQDSIQTLQT